jgi:3-dehydroquinate dehydratase I
MICVSIGNLSVEKCLERLHFLDFAEVRLDTMDIDVPSVKRIFSMPLKLIATCRRGTYDDSLREKFLLAAIESGAAYVDIEMNSSDQLKTRIIERAIHGGSKVILSYHNFNRTPSFMTLKNVVTESFLAGANLTKIACMVHYYTDNLRLLSLLGIKKYTGRLIVTGMGKSGKITRVASVFLGSPFNYSFFERGYSMAPGQIDMKRFKKIIELIENEQS